MRQSRDIGFLAAFAPPRAAARASNGGGPGAATTPKAPSSAAALRELLIEAVYFRALDVAFDFGGWALALGRAEARGELAVGLQGPSAPAPSGGAGAPPTALTFP